MNILYILFYVLGTGCLIFFVIMYFLIFVGLGENIQKAAETAYHGVDAVRFEGMQYRHDIGYRAMK